MADRINIKDLPYLKVGPYHTNTVAGLDLAFDILRRKKNNNKHRSYYALKRLNSHFFCIYYNFIN